MFIAFAEIYSTYNADLNLDCLVSQARSKLVEAGIAPKKRHGFSLAPYQTSPGPRIQVSWKMWLGSGLYFLCGLQHFPGDSTGSFVYCFRASACPSESTQQRAQAWTSVFGPKLSCLTARKKNRSYIKVEGATNAHAAHAYTYHVLPSSRYASRVRQSYTTVAEGEARTTNSSMQQDSSKVGLDLLMLVLSYTDSLHVNSTIDPGSVLERFQG